jgi:hypothetical protein
MIRQGKDEILWEPVGVSAHCLQERLCIDAIQLRQIRIQQHRQTPDREYPGFQFDNVGGGLVHCSAVVSSWSAAKSAQQISACCQKQLAPSPL